MEQRTTPMHHPDEEFLAAYAAGAVTGAQALIAATHLTFCSVCRTSVAAFERVGGEMLEQVPGVDTQTDVFPDLGAAVASEPQAQDTNDFPYAPRPLRSLLTAHAGQWLPVWFGVKELPIPGFAPEARLLWIPAGRRMPRHDHNGEEMTLVLRGSFSDATGRYGMGDLQIGMPGLDHQPHAGAEGPCVCLVVESGGLKLSGWLGRLVSWRSRKGSAGFAA